MFYFLTKSGLNYLQLDNFIVDFQINNHMKHFFNHE